LPIIGIIFALLSGAGLQEIYNRFSDNMNNAYQYWLSIRDGETRDEEKEDKILKTETRWNKLSIIPPILGWISGLIFAVACGLMAWELGK
jgi:hypothetical protein